MGFQSIKRKRRFDQDHVKIYGDMDQSTRSICKNIGVEPTRRGTTRSVVRRVARRQYFAYTLSALMHGIRIFALSCDLHHFNPLKCVLKQSK